MIIGGVPAKILKVGDKLKILVITRSAWDTENGNGNTMNNLLYGWDKEEIANLYFRDEKPNNSTCKYYFSISDKEIIKSYLFPRYIPGNRFEWEEEINSENDENKVYKYFSKKGNNFPLIVQNIAWNKHFWNQKKLDQFLEDFKPDIIFTPSFHTIFTHKMLHYIKNKTNAKVALFHGDDYLNPENYKRNIIDKAYFVSRFKNISKSIDLADLNYCISSKQKKEYEMIFNKEFKILTKGADFSELSSSNSQYSDVKKIKVVYIGSLLYGRIKTLIEFVDKLKILNNKSDIKIYLDIYSQNQPSKDELNLIEQEGISKFNGKIPYEQVKDKINEYDIVLYIESFDKKEMNDTRLSFSTKIVDYLHSQRTILAIGPKSLAGMSYLKENDSAICINEKKEIHKKLKEITDNPEILNYYSEKAWILGMKNHDIKTIRQNLKRDFQYALEGSKNENSAN